MFGWRAGRAGRCAWESWPSIIRRNIIDVDEASPIIYYAGCSQGGAQLSATQRCL
jgi:hypothetical protein